MASEKKDLKQYYSCKRKPDIVTWVAIVLFLIAVLLQVYLVVFLPMQLRKGETLAYHVARDKMLQNIDLLRSSLNRVKTTSDLAEGELQMTKSAFDRLMLYTRIHKDQLDLAQVTDLTQRFQMFTFTLNRWKAKPAKFVLTPEPIDKQKYIRMLEQHILEQEKLPQ